MPTPLSQLSEDTLVRSLSSVLRAPDVGVGIGDDCAVLAEGRLLKTDSVIEGRHYLPQTSPALVGRKAIARVISDLAAMGGVPEAFLVTCGLRGSSALEQLREMYAAMDALCMEYGGHIVGGETCKVGEGEPEFFSITGYGHCISAPILRSGAQVGDGIYVTGELGNTFHTEHHLRFCPRQGEARWLVQNARPSAMMDLSDGIARDLPRLAHCSAVGYSIVPESLPLRAGATPQTALTDGEDYELLFTLPPALAEQLRDAPFQVSHIGEITTNTATPLEGGWDHLAP